MNISQKQLDVNNSANELFNELLFKNGKIEWDQYPIWKNLFDKGLYEECSGILFEFCCNNKTFEPLRFGTTLDGFHEITNGQSLLYWRNGQVAKTAERDFMGRANGLTVVYDQDGTVTHKITYVDGDKVSDENDLDDYDPEEEDLDPSRNGENDNDEFNMAEDGDFKISDGRAFKLEVNEKTKRKITYYLTSVDGEIDAELTAIKESHTGDFEFEEIVYWSDEPSEEIQEEIRIEACKALDYGY